MSEALLPMAATLHYRPVDIEGLSFPDFLVLASSAEELLKHPRV